MASKSKIPSKEEWSGYENDLDVRHFHKLAFGKSHEEIQSLFESGRSIERSDELLFSPRAVFQYYVVSFSNYLESEVAKEDSDGASSFLRLLISREKKDPGSVAQVYLNLKNTIEFVSSNQAYFNADINIYGSFPELAEQIKKACNA